MPPKFAPRHRVRVSSFTRLRAWWMGIDNAEALAKFGERSFLSSIWVEWRGTLVASGCAFAFLVGRSQSNRANYFLDNIELNRQQYYKRDFAPAYVEGAPSGVYDGVQAYSYKDEASGLTLNADNRFVSEESRDERQARLQRIEITDDMVRGAQQLLDSKRYSTAHES
ncbi:hypothetical protein STCU_00734 [Strigomonas culicis]|uniref:Uncharacterized protein n=1 Tax=Strigomonas culicis TaxID=28005 RepID=S9UN51_9TRYP|nr:hypothetical protein STCU_07218 [Strigomonas culicis]EPY30134.1 hypothetical protein STCU_04219 [Strigomonas culicis]EPY36142.1 hypothetical protein STCU_00734 [Strigomonas culicis]|eukprot:EPY24363.1 hypothetical protein STCU_07218 [Strigomonas culicis]